MNVPVLRGARTEKLADAGEGQPRIVAQQQCAAIVGIIFQFAAGDDDAGMAPGEGIGMAHAGKYAELAVARLFQIRDIAHHLGGAARLGKPAPTFCAISPSANGPSAR